MYNLEGKDFFDNIRRTVKLSHFVASIIPLALLVYFSIKYVYPYVTAGNTSNIPIKYRNPAAARCSCIRPGATHGNKGHEFFY